MTRPAPALSEPASTTHRGATGRSTAYPEKPVNATTARATIPGTDQMEAGAAGPSGTGTWLERGPVTRARPGRRPSSPSSRPAPAPATRGR
ncbi:hypothetical protein [Ornithinimicrobium kibberense]|uniref:hypothetical protein n=1 Tax=Ornithinimicrobium kibberense TaxID=282060 RepID=UPI00361BC961